MDTTIEGGGDQAKFVKRNFEPGYVQALAIPTGIAINNAMGLLTPFGGAEGYKAVLPSEEDPTKTEILLLKLHSNILWVELVICYLTMNLEKSGQM